MENTELKLTMKQTADLAAKIAEKILKEAGGDEEAFIVLSIAVSLLFNGRVKLTDQA